MTNKREIIGASVAAFLAGIGIFIWLAGAHDSAQLVSVLAARSDLIAPKIIRPEDVGYIKVPRASLPKGAITNGAAAVGKALVHSLVQNQIITTRDVTRGRGENSDALLVPGGMVGMVVPSSWLAGPFPRVKAHDLVSLFVAIPITKVAASGGAAEVVRAAEVLAVQGERDGAPPRSAPGAFVPRGRAFAPA